MDCLFIGQNIIELSSVKSTNNYLIDLSQNVNLVEGTIVVANHQTLGKGQRSNSWHSEAGKSLCFSILFAPKIDVSHQFSFNKFIALSLCQALQEYGISAKIKWPNDIFIGLKKVAGILVENTVRACKIDKSVVGIGVNVSNNLIKIPSATSLEKCLEVIPTLSELLEMICKKVEKNYFIFKKQPLLVDNLYHENLFRIGEDQLFLVGEKTFNGIIQSVNKNGQLLIEVNGITQHYRMGEIKFMI